MTFEGLVPDDFEEFRSVTFWDGFFQKRKQKAFEWYGEWRQLQPLVWGTCARPNKQILMLGCGNSDLSAQMYDAGCQAVTNIDFSKVCIKEMMMKNLRKRPLMKWLVMDMTKLTFKSGSFHIAFDKGALDALMGEDTEAASIAGSQLLSEVQRVLNSCEGHYLCVTLGQPHVLEKLLSSFGSGWSICIDRVPPSADMASSPLQPFLVTVARCSQQPQHTQETDGQVDDLNDIELDEGHNNSREGQIGDCPEPVSAVQLSFGADAGAVNAEQLADIIKIVEQENKLRASGKRQQQQSKCVTHPDAQAEAASQYDQLQPGRRCMLSLSQSEASTTAQTYLQDGKGQQQSARFTAAVLDVDAATARRAVRDCAVFIVPQGREHEWLFASPEGQAQVAQGCSAKRVIVVALNRGHEFGSLKAVQAELSPLMVDLAPIASRQLEAAVPFMTTQEGIGKRTVLETAESTLTGNISIEDVTMHDDEGRETVMRRMVFTSNRNLVQSEAVLCPASTAAQASNGNIASKINGQQADAAPSGTVGNKAKRKAKAAKQKALPAGNRQSANNQEQQPLVVDHSQLACDYHKGIIAGLSLIQPHLSTFSWTDSPQAVRNGPLHTQAGPQQGSQHGSQQGSQQEPQQQQPQQQLQSQQAEQHQQAKADSESVPGAQTSGMGSGRPQALVVGLGGGALPVFLNRHCKMDVLTVELDPVVVDLAHRLFGFAESTSLQAQVGDGLEAIAQLQHRLVSTSAAQAQSSNTAKTTSGQHPDPSHDSSPTQGLVSHNSWPSQHLDLLVVDAGSGDASVAMSCPPAPFLESRFLGQAKQVLRHGGMLAVNCVSRAAEPYTAAVKALQAVFPEVYELDIDEDVNKVLFALSQPLQSPGSTAPNDSSKHGSKKSKEAKGSQGPKPVLIDGSAAGVQVLKHRLQGLVET